MFTVHKGGWYDVKVSQDGKYVFGMNYWGCIYVFSTTDDSLHGNYCANHDQRFFTLSPNGKYLFIAEGKNLKAIDIAQSNDMGSIATLSDNISSIDFSTEGNELFLGGRGGIFAIYETPKEWLRKTD